MEISVTFPDRPATKNALQVTKKLGEGKFCVYQAYSSLHHTNFALKIFPRTTFGTKQYQKEKLMTKLTHPNIIRNIPIKHSDSKYYAMLTEFAQYGDFFRVVTRGLLGTEILARTYFHHLIKGLEHMHSQGIAHLDLKLENLMMSSDFELKIIDFDQAQLTTDKKVTSGGSVGYRAPEIVNEECQNPAAADIFSAGIILYAFQAKEYPFLEVEDPTNQDPRCYSTFVNNNRTFWRAKLQLKDGPTLFNEDFIELVNGMLHYDPKKRWGIKEIKRSKWFKGPVLGAEGLKAEMKTKCENNLK